MRGRCRARPMARHLLGQGDREGLAAHLDNMQKAADLRKTAVETAHEQVKMRGTHADTMATLVDALAPQQPQQAAGGG